MVRCKLQWVQSKKMYIMATTNTEIESPDEDAAEPKGAEQTEKGHISEEFQAQLHSLLDSASPAELEYMQNECMKPSKSGEDVSMDDYKEVME